jgi:hypothetical protein
MFGEVDFLLMRLKHVEIDFVGLECLRTSGDCWAVCAGGDHVCAALWADERLDGSLNPHMAAGHQLPCSGLVRTQQ